ncbi:hypothetical protein EJ04DRAFT_559597 [Polyplosphaeria fusca]|uniref:Uncharacterized protein n=1 Tax=Polyplosphaeria fusca TaxID=682080 RepID=A0A9P4V6C2_9PLEO|nr:hypothetical protein EJ04DRAFT_559597 [Polyplosphaeria fusca]
MARQRPDDDMMVSKPPIKSSAKIYKKPKQQQTRYKAPATDSQDMLALKPLLKQHKGNDKGVGQFRAKVERDRQSLRETLQKRLQKAQAADDYRRNDIRATIFSAIASEQKEEDPKSAMTTLPGTLIARSVHFPPACAIQDASNELLAQYKRVNNLAETTSPHSHHRIIERWQQGVKDTERLFGVGQRTAVRRVSKVLGIDDAMTRNEEPEEGIEMLEDLYKLMPNSELQKSLQYAERGVKRMVKGLPKET